MDRVKRIWCLSPMRVAKVQASLRIRAVSPEPPLLAHTSIESRGTFRQTARSLAPLNGWACAVKICHDGMLEDTNSLDGAPIYSICVSSCPNNYYLMKSECKLCDSSCETCTTISASEVVCLSCKPGYLLMEGKGKCKQSCEQGYYKGRKLKASYRYESAAQQN